MVLRYFLEYEHGAHNQRTFTAGSSWVPNLSSSAWKLRKRLPTASAIAALVHFSNSDNSVYTKATAVVLRTPGNCYKRRFRCFTFVQEVHTSLDLLAEHGVVVFRCQVLDGILEDWKRGKDIGLRILV